MTVRYAILTLPAVAAALAAVLSGPLDTPLAGQTTTPQQPSEVMTEITGEPGAPPRYAVPDFIALSADAEVQAAAKVIGEVLWSDLDFEREFYMIPRDTYRSIPVSRSIEDVPFDRWRELGADGLIIGTVERTGSGIRVTTRLYNVRDGRSVFGKEYSGSAANPRLYAHTLSDELHQQQRALAGVARTKLSFSSDRDNERVAGSIENRGVKEIYIADYDAANQRRVTVNRGLNITPAWTPDGRGIAYTSYRRGSPDIFISLIYQGTLENPTAGKGDNFLPAFSPDGTRIAFMSNRDGNPELYVMNRDGSGLRRLTSHPAIDVTPTWAPSGTQIAFTSDRSGSPQIYIIGADGLNLRKLTSESYCDRPTWSPAPYNEVAYASRTGPGYDIMALDLATGERRQLTFGEGSNESPSYSPNGRHIAFSSTRAGRTQVFTMARDGKNLRQITKAGNNFTPSWSR
jgi:TolB protein